MANSTSYKLGTTGEDEYEVYPKGWYRSRLFDFEAKTDGTFGNGNYWIWKFEIVQPGYEGKRLDVITSAPEMLTPRTKARKLLDALNNGALDDSVEIDVGDFFGSECFLRNDPKAGDNGVQKNRVEEDGFMSLAEFAAMSEAAAPTGKASGPTPMPEAGGYLRRWLAAVGALKKTGATIQTIQTKAAAEVDADPLKFNFKNLSEMEQDFLIEWAEKIVANPKQYDANLDEIEIPF